MSDKQTKELHHSCIPSQMLCSQCPYHLSNQTCALSELDGDAHQVLKRALMDDMANHLTPSIMQTIESSGAGGTPTAASKLEDMRQVMHPP